MKEKIQNIYNIINKIILDEREIDSKQGNLYFTSGRNNFLDREKTFKKLNEALDLIEEVKSDFDFLKL